MNHHRPDSNPPFAGMSPAQLADLSAELEGIRARVYKELGETDTSDVRRVASIKRFAEVGGRTLLFAGAIPQAWSAGVTLLAVSKMLDNMAIGHNVMHGQYDWMKQGLG